MKTQQITVSKLIADEGKVLTDGTSYGKIVYLGNDRDASEFYEITDAEYEKISEAEGMKNV
jgi:hypothetical protein